MKYINHSYREIEFISRVYQLDMYIHRLSIDYHVIQTVHISMTKQNNTVTINKPTSMQV